jgi:hypothetical protein
MTTEAIINKTIKTLHTLPPNKIEEVADFVDYVSKKHEEHILNSGIEKMIEQSVAFQFLHDEEDLYSVKDIKEKY